MWRLKRVIISIRRPCLFTVEPAAPLGKEKLDSLNSENKGSQKQEVWKEITPAVS